MDLPTTVNDIADVLKSIDAAGARFKEFHPGVGPHGEPQLVKLIAQALAAQPKYSAGVMTMRTPDLCIRGHWALEIKIARPFGDNGRAAENWSVNLLHPYNGNTSLLGDCLKLQALACKERKGVVAIGYQHTPPQVELEPLWKSFEVIAADVMHLKLSARAMARRGALMHPVHQEVVVVGWEIVS